MGDRAGEGISYCGLSNAYDSLRQFSTAIEYHQRYLEIVKEVGDKDGEGKGYCLLCRIHLRQRELKTAIECYQRQLEISKEVEDKTGEACSLCSLGSIFECQGNLQLNDRWKICYRNQHQSAYEGLWRINLNQG